MTLRDRLLRMRDVEARTGLSRSSIYRAISAGTFPTWMKVGKRASRWSEQAVEAWVAGNLATEPHDTSELTRRSA